MGQKVEFEGTIHEFPSDWDNEQIGAALQMFGDGQPVAEREPPQNPITPAEQEALSLLHTRPDDGAADHTDLEEQEGLLSLNSTQETFRNTIAKIETGGLDNEWTRTKVKGSGSTAYGTYQITRGLIRGYLDTKSNLFNESEIAAMRELDKRQSIAIKVGGKDRASYEAGGANHAQAKRWTQELGFASVSDMLDAFDYGGDYGLADNVDWQFQYENFARRMMNDHLKMTGGDALEAASIWHGGTNWKKGKHKKQTDIYRKKYEAFSNATNE